MKTAYLVMIVIISLLSFTCVLPASGLSGSALFMKANSTGKIYANFTFHMLNHETWNLTQGIYSPGIYLGINEPPVPVDPNNMTIVVEPNTIKAGKNSIAVTYTITAQNNSKGVYALFLYFCGLQPLVVGLNESQVDPAIFNKYFTAVYNCPSMNSDPDLKITGYSGILQKNIQINSTGLDSTHSSISAAPEFPYAMLILVTSFVSLITFYRIKFK